MRKLPTGGHVVLEAVITSAGTVDEVRVVASGGPDARRRGLCGRFAVALQARNAERPCGSGLTRGNVRFGLTG